MRWYDGAMEPAKKTPKALAIGGIILAGGFAVIAMVKPEYLDLVLHPGDERNERIKKEMERQKGIETSGQPSPSPGPGNESKGATVTPTPVPEETASVDEEEARGSDLIPRLECISGDQIVKIIDASDEARDGRVFGISGATDGSRIMVDYKKKTFLGIGSGENQIEGILRRGLRNRFPDRLIRSLRVRSAGNRRLRRGDRDVKVEILEIEIPQDRRRCVSVSAESR
jgi:hypothetical protein